jgi:hypothetical protein
LIAQLQPLATIGEPLQLGLSGGKDSRLCLALATAAGLGDRLTTHTGGTQEVPFARAVAAAAGVAHRVGPPKPASTTNPSSPAPGDTWHRVRTNITRYDAIVCAWSALKNPIFAAVSIRGYGLPHGIQLSADASLLQSYGELDALGVVRREEAEAERAWLREWLSRNEHDVRADLLPEKFYVDFRLGHWSGPNIQGAPVHVDINPLLMQEAWRKCLQLSPAARRAERFHFEVMRRAAPELVTLPFYEDGWAPEIVASSSLALPVRPLPGQPRASRSSLRRSPLVRQVRAVLKRRSPPARAPQRRTATEAWSFLERDRDAIASLIDEAARETAFDTICDAKRLRRAVQSSEPFVRVGRARQVTNAVGVALTLLGRAEPVV